MDTSPWAGAKGVGLPASDQNISPLDGDRREQSLRDRSKAAFHQPRRNLLHLERTPVYHLRAWIFSQLVDIKYVIN
jgi:hypothetical protein